MRVARGLHENATREGPQDKHLKTVLDREHVPGSYNVPSNLDDFVDHVKNIASTDDTVVVSCSSPDCEASPTAGRKLVDAGFKDVTHFEGGMAEWKQAGYEVESGAPATR